jgi:hypothetical protein
VPAAFKRIGLGAQILARKRNLIAFKGPVAKSYERGASRSDPNWDLTGSVFSISEHSVDISWLPPAQPGAAGPVAAVVAPDERSAELAAVVAEAPDEAEARPLGAAEALASLPVEPGAAVVAVQPGAVAQLAEFAASARRAEWALQLPQPVWIAAVAVAVEPRPALASFPERPALPQGPEPSRRLSVDPPGVLAHSDHQWPASPPAEFEGQVSYWEWFSAIHGPEAPH